MHECMSVLFIPFPLSIGRKKIVNMHFLLKYQENRYQFNKTAIRFLSSNFFPDFYSWINNRNQMSTRNVQHKGEKFWNFDFFSLGWSKCCRTFNWIHKLLPKWIKYTNEKHQNVCVCVQLYGTFRIWQIFWVELHFSWKQKPWRQQNIFTRIRACVSYLYL